MEIQFDSRDKNSVLSYAKLLKGKTLREICADDIVNHNFSGKGNFGQLLEKYYFGYNPNSKKDADFAEIGMELKSSPLKKLANDEYRSKERLVLSIIDYFKVAQQTFETSDFLRKNSNLLLVFYLFQADANVLDFVIKLVDEWDFPTKDLAIIKKDWEKIKNKIDAGKAHELSEGDTFYLGACTKGANASSLRKQPFSNELAKQRAFSLKQGYVNHIIAALAAEEESVYGKIIEIDSLESGHSFEASDAPTAIEATPHYPSRNSNQFRKAVSVAEGYESLIKSAETAKSSTIDEVVISKFEQYYGFAVKEIVEKLQVNLNESAKGFYANLTKAILGIGLDKEIEEFQKAEIITRTVRLKENNLPKEDISFPTFKYSEIVAEDWETSDFKNLLEHKFLFIFYQFEGEELILRKAKFWNMPYMDMLSAKRVWAETKKIISRGDIVREVKTNKSGKKVRYTNFPNKDFSHVSHVRPHAKDSRDAYPLPVKDKLTNVSAYAKHCFWLNNSYVRDSIYLEDK